MIKHMVEHVEFGTFAPSITERIGGVVGVVKDKRAIAEQFQHAELRFTVALIDGGIDQHWALATVGQEVTTPKIAVQQCGGLRRNDQQRMQPTDDFLDSVLQTFRGTALVDGETQLVPESQLREKLAPLMPHRIGLGGGANKVISVPAETVLLRRLPMQRR